MAKKKVNRFKKLYPLLWDAMQKSMKVYEIYGLKFKCHSGLRICDFIKREDKACTHVFCPLIDGQRLSMRHAFKIFDN